MTDSNPRAEMTTELITDLQTENTLLVTHPALSKLWGTVDYDIS